MSDEELLKMDDDALEAAVFRLNGYIKDLQNENVSLGYIRKEALKYWNEGSTMDITDYQTILQENIITIDSSIVPTLKDYVNTMTILVEEIRAAKRRAIEAAREAARAKASNYNVQ